MSNAVSPKAARAGAELLWRYLTMVTFLIVRSSLTLLPNWLLFWKTFHHLFFHTFFRLFHSVLQTEQVIVVRRSMLLYWCLVQPNNLFILFRFRFATYSRTVCRNSFIRIQFRTEHLDLLENRRLLVNKSRTMWFTLFSTHFIWKLTVGRYLHYTVGR